MDDDAEGDNGAVNVDDDDDEAVADALAASDSDAGEVGPPENENSDAYSRRDIPDVAEAVAL